MQKLKNLKTLMFGEMHLNYVSPITESSKIAGIMPLKTRFAVHLFPPSNIAEGFERQSNKEFIHFLFIAKGSTGEVRTQLMLVFRLGLVAESDYHFLLENTRKISAQLYNLIKIRKERFS